MAKAFYDTTPLLRRAAGGFDASCDEVNAQIKVRQVRRTGRLAGDYSVQALPESGGRYRARVRNPLVYAGPVEKGAFVRKGRGPHMRGNFVVRDTIKAVYGPAMRRNMAAKKAPTRTRVVGKRVVLQ